MLVIILKPTHGQHNLNYGFYFIKAKGKLYIFFAAPNYRLVSNKFVYNFALTSGTTYYILFLTMTIIIIKKNHVRFESTL